MNKIAVVDLRRPVREGFLRELKENRWDRVFAFSPLAAWLLEEAGVSFETGETIAGPAWFKEEGLRNFDRLEAAFAEAFDSEKESWLGLMYQFKFIVDYAFLEERRLAFFEGAQVHAFADFPHESRESAFLEDHLCNGAALYLWAVPPERFTRVARKPETISRVSVHLQRLTLPRIRRKLEKTLSGLDLGGSRPSLVTRYEYDWETYRPELQARFSTLTPEAVILEASSGFALPPDQLEKEIAPFAKALEAEFASLLPRTYPYLSRILFAKLRAYAAVRAPLAANLAGLCARRDIRGALSSFCGSGEEFLVNYYLKAAGRPALFYQHGGYMGMVRTIRTNEAVPASHNFVFGRADAEFFRKIKPAGEVHAVGSAALDAMTPDRERPGHFLYVLFPNIGNAMYTSGELSQPEMSHTALFTLHRRVIELFGRHPKATLHVREAPAQTGWYLYEPLKEFVRKKGFKNIRFDVSRVGADQFLSGYEGVLLEYPCTTLLQALAKKKTMVCHTGGCCRLTPEGEGVLRQAVACSQTDDGFLALIEDWLKGRRPQTQEAARREYLELYGGGVEPSAPKVWPHLERLLGLAPAGAAR